MDLQSPPGVFDILPRDSKEPWKNSHLWRFVEAIMHTTAEQFGFQEIRTPIFEKTELFLRGVGEGTDIVSKEMYTFIDKGDRSLTLRPEGTACAARAYIEHHLGSESAIQKLYYIGPMFRYERAQAGRYRQHHQFGVEAIGVGAPEQDAELIDLAYTLYKRLGLKNLRVMVNSIGDESCRMNYKKALEEYFSPHYDRLSDDSKKRLQKNPLRILDSKDPRDKEIAAQAPSILNFLSPEAANHFEQLLILLNALGIPYQVNDRIVRGLDYYNRTVFEIVADELGAQNSIGGGGRYDRLIGTLGGEATPSTGFATGIERIIQSLIGQQVSLPEAYRPTIFLIPLGEEAKVPCFEILHDLRHSGIKAQMDFSGRKVGKAMSYANHIQAKFVAVIGPDELQNKQVELKNMDTGEKIAAPLFRLSRILQIEAEGEDFLRVWKEMNTPFEHPLEADFFIKKLQQSIHNTKNLTEELQAAMKKMQEIL